MSRHWLTAFGIVAVLALGGTAWSVNGAWNERRDAVAARNAEQSRVADARATEAQARNRLAQDRIDGARAGGELAAAKISVGFRQEQIRLTSADRDQAGAARDARQVEARIVRQCLDGAGTALDALRRRDTAATVFALRAVDGPCRAAQAAQGGPAPAYGFDFPDPFVLPTLGGDVAFATNSSGGNVQVLRRAADGSWTTAGDALARFPAWAAWGRTWAPSVLARPGGYVLYYTVREAETGYQCVSRAVSQAPAGPYVDTSTGPLVCGTRGAIDPEAVVAADGTPVLLWKREHPATIQAQPLTPDGLQLAGSERELLRATASWQGTNVEAPSMLVTGAGSWLFFSANDWNGSRYSIGVVHCAGALGPCDRAAGGPLLASRGTLAGPGGASVFASSPGVFRLAFHAYVTPNVGYPASRLLFTAGIDLASGRPVLGA